MTTDIYTPSNPPYCAAPHFFDTQQIALCRVNSASYTGIPRHFDPFNPEKRFSGWPTFSEPGPPSLPDTQYIPSRDFSRTYPGDITKYVPFDPENFDPESFFFGGGGSSPSSAEPDPKLHPQDPKLLDDQSPAKCVPLTSENYHLYGFSQTYPGDPTKYTPFDPENFDPESFFFGAKFDTCDPAPDPKLLDVSFDDQSPAKVDPFNFEIGVWDDYSPSYPGDPSKYFPFDPENFDAENFFSFGGLPPKSKPCDPEIHPRDLKLLDDRFDDQSLVRKLTIVESSGTAANKWNKKESSSASKAAWNTPAEEQTGGSVGEESSRETGYFARKCSLGADSGKSGSDGGGNIGRALCTRMP